MRPTKRFALMLAICLIFTNIMPALSEEPIDEEAVLADSVDESTGLYVDNGEAVIEGTVDEVATEPENIEAAPVIHDAAAQQPEAGGKCYAVVTVDGAPVYLRQTDWDTIALLGAGDLVLVTGVAGDRVAVAFNAAGVVLGGFVDPADITCLDAAQSAEYLDKVSTEEMALLENDLNWPMPALSDVIWGQALAVLANYSDMSNDTVYTMNGVQVCASMVPDPGSGRCWTYAQGIYELVWGCRFSENFAGNAQTGYNLLRELNDAQRKLTPSHLKAFILRTQPGATIRIGGCTTSCSSFENDGLGCGHSGHSLIVVDYNSDGVVTMDSHSNSQHTRFYTWQGFCTAWSGYPYVKYIKWPGAGAIASNEISEDGSADIPVTGVTLSQTELTLDVGSTATLIANVEPSDATQKGVEWASTDTDVATVIDGVVTGVNAGTATLWARTLDGAKTANCVVTVKKPIAQKALTKRGSNGTIYMALGEQLQLTADFAIANGWSLASVKTSNARSVTISDTGLVTAVGEGKAKLTVYTTNRKKAKLTVKVVDPYKPVKVALSRSGTIRLKVGETLKLDYALMPTTAKTTIAWKSTKEKVATVDADGNVVALSKGKCYVGVITANGKYAKVKIKVSN